MGLGGLELLLLVVIFFFTSVIGVVTGANSLITVPAMLAFGIDPRVAIATNMLALTFMSVGATLPFLRQGVLDTRRAPLLIMLTLIGSLGGAALVLVLPAASLPLIISIAMMTVALFVLFKREDKVVDAHPPTRVGVWTGCGLTLLLGVYGGFFSGGYVTLLTAAYLAFFRMSFVQAVANTKLINVFSSLVASAFFLWQGLVDLPLGLLLSVTMFIGATLGARLTLRLEPRLIKRLFVVVVLLLALKTLLVDVLGVF